MRWEVRLHFKAFNASKSLPIEGLHHAAELEGMSEEELRRKYEQHARGSAGVPGAHGREDFSDMIGKEMAKRKQKADRDREGRREKEFKF